MAYTEAPQSLTSQAQCLPASIYNSIPPDNGHLTWAGSMSGAPISGYQSGPSSLHGTLYSAVSAHPYSGNYASVGPETTAAHHMAAISGEYQAARLQRAPPHGHSARYYTHRAIAAHPYGAIQPGYDMATFRQKTATKETTSTLKAWLRDHKTNPYPNKGDKVMLAMVSRMTLTQVSTWFANARRRMKKDKTDYMDGNHSDSEYGSKGDTERAPSDRVPRCHGEHVVSTADDTNAKYTDTVTESADRVTESTDNIIPPSKRARKCIQRLFSPDGRTDISIDTCSSPESTYGIYCAISPDADHDFASRRVTHPSSPLSPVLMHAEKTETLHRTSSGTGAGSNKSKIWSITDIIGTKSETPHTKTDDVNTSPDTHTYSSSNGSLPSIYASQTDLYQSWLASQTNTAVFEHYEGSIASCELLEHC